MKKIQLGLIMSVMVAGATVWGGGVDWIDGVADCNEAKEIIVDVEKGDAVVVSPIDKEDKFAALNGVFEKFVVPVLTTNQQGALRFDLKNRPGWEYHGRDQRTAIYRRGKGLIVLSANDLEECDQFSKDIKQMLTFQNQQLALRGVALRNKRGWWYREPQRGKDGIIEIKFDNFSDEPKEVVAELIVDSKLGKKTLRGKGKSTKRGGFSVKIIGNFAAYGKCDISLRLVEWGGKKNYEIRNWKVDWPEYLQVKMPFYRGLVSEARRTPEVRLGVLFDDAIETDFVGRIVQVEVEDPKGKTIYEEELIFGEGNELTFYAPLTAESPVGKYSVRAESTDGFGKKFVAENTFKVVPVRKGQVFVDQDGGLLADGKPWFPFGLYHVYTTNDINTIADIGVDLVQMFDGFADRKMLDHMRAKGVRLAYETAAWPQVINNWRKWGGVPPPIIDFETNEVFRAAAKMVLDEYPDVLALWYSCDEAGSGEIVQGTKRIKNYWMGLDPEDHPTYLVTTREGDQEEAGDIYGLDHYPRSFGAKDPMTNLVKWIDNLYSNSPVGQSIFSVPQSFGTTNRHKETPEELKCMAYLSMVHGVKGVFWYCWHDGGNQGCAHDPRARQAIKEVTTEAKEFKNALLSSNFKQLRSKDNKVHACLCGDDKTGRFFICVNGDDNPSDGAFSSRDLRGLKFEPLFGAPAKSPDGHGNFAVPFKGAERMVWRIVTK